MVPSRFMEEESPDEWEIPEASEELPVAPEHLDRFRGLLTELVISAASAPVLVITSLWIQPPVRHSATPWIPGPPLTLWETALYKWLPLLMGALAFGCVVWLVLVLFRLAALKRETPPE